MPSPNLISADESRRLLLAMSQQQSGDGVLQILVQELHQKCGAALARVWLLTPNSDCSCQHPELCTNKSECLQLVASAGQSLDGKDWSNTDGEFARVPLGFGKVGHIAATRQAVEEKKITSQS